MAHGKTKLTFAVDYTGRDGNTYKSGETKEVDFQYARALVAEGIAAEAPKSGKSTPAAAADK